MADEPKKKMSIAEILAAARKMDGDGDTSAPSKAEPPEKAETSAQQSEAESQAAAPADKPATSAASGKRPSTADILAMARAGDKGKQPSEQKAPAEKPKPAAKAPSKTTAKAESAPKATEPKDTASILAAARKQHQPGPVSKAEAAARTKPDAPRAAKPAKTKLAVPPMPAKPDYAKTKPAKEKRTEERRTVMSIMLGSFLGLGFTSLTLSNMLWGLATLRMMFPNVLIEPPSRFKVGFPGDFSPGSVETKFKAQFGVWVVNDEYKGQPQIFALRTVCTHLGCTPNWLDGEQKFKCPCHGSGFYKDGINFEGPAPRPLERYAISIADDGQLEIDKSKLFQEEMGHWADAASFVAV